MTANQLIASFTAVGILIIWILSLVVDEDPTSRSSSSDLDSALEKGAGGRATEMTDAEMEAFRIEQQRISSEHKNKILGGLTPEEKALRDYEDRMILQGETQSNPHYEELQRKAAESR